MNAPLYVALMLATLLLGLMGLGVADYLTNGNEPEGGGPSGSATRCGSVDP